MSNNYRIKAYEYIENGNQQKNGLYPERLKFLKPVISLFRKVLNPEKPLFEIIVIWEEEGFVFYLDKNLLEIIKSSQIQKDKIELRLDSRLRFTVFQNIFLKNFKRDKSKKNINLPTEFTFVTCYERQKVIRTLIALDGDIIQQIRGDNSINSEDKNNIFLIHYWLSNQLIKEGMIGDILIVIDSFIWIIRIPLIIVWFFTGNNANKLWLLIYWPIIELMWKLVILDKFMPWLLPKIENWLWKQLINPNSSVKTLIERFIRFG